MLFYIRKVLQLKKMGTEGNVLKEKRQRLVVKFVVGVVLVLLLSNFGVLTAQAAAITSVSDTMSNITDSALSNHTVQFTVPTGLTTGQSITITFPTGFALGSVGFADMDLGYGASCSSLSQQTLAGTPSGATWGASQTGQVVTLLSGSGTISAGNCVQIKIGTNATYGGTGTNQITNQTVAQNASSQKILIGGTMADSGSLAVVIVSNAAVAVTGQVDPEISCAIDHNTSAFGTFVLGSIATANTTPTWTIGTNATNGYNLTVRSAGNGTNAGLYGATPNYVIKSADSAEDATSDLSVAATIGYGAQGTKTNGDAGSATTNISSPYTSTSTTVGRLQLTDQTLASANGPVSNATVTTTLKAKVTGLVPSGAYVDTLTYICTGIF